MDKSLTIGLVFPTAVLLVFSAVISVVPISQKSYAQGSPGVGSVGGSGSGNPNSGGNPIILPGLGTSSGGSSSSGSQGGAGSIVLHPHIHLFPDGGVGTKGAPGGSGPLPGSGAYECTSLNCGGGGGVLNFGGNSVGAGGAP